MFRTFIQCIIRQLDSLHLKAAYENDQPVGLRLQVRAHGTTVCSYSLIRNTFNIFKSAALSQLAPLFQYFEDQWFTRTPLAMWNVHTACIRTNNDVEGENLLLCRFIYL